MCLLSGLKGVSYLGSIQPVFIEPTITTPKVTDTDQFFSK